MRIAYLDCFAGISGDMFLGALLDAGVPLGLLIDAVSKLGLGANLRVEKVDRSGIFSTKVHVFEGEHLADAAGAPAPAEAQTHGHPHSHEHTHELKQVHQHSHAASHDHADQHEHSHSHERLEPREHGPLHSRENAHVHVHGRPLSEIRELIHTAPLSHSVKEFAIRTFELLGHSEARIHNVPVEQIHFHEVGAVDAIVDIVAASAGIEYLNQQGALDWYCSAVNVGGGMVECAHGTFPVPAPATADLLKGIPTYSAHVQKELVTPTGAAMLRALSPEFLPQPLMRVQSIGYGAGTRNPVGFPNVLRLSLGETVADAKPPSSRHDEQSVTVIQVALDDASPQLLAHVAERVLETGALDVMLTPVIMKKGRPGTLMTVLCDPSQSSVFEDLLLRESTTLGIRKHHEQRSCLDRRHITVSTPYGEISMKLGELGGEEVNAMPEFEDCRAAARRHDVPVKQVMQAAIAAHADAPAPR